MNSYIQWCLRFSQWLESPRQAVSHHVMLTTQKWLTICPFTRPSERLTGLDYSSCHDVHTLEIDNIDAILHMNYPCNATIIIITQRITPFNYLSYSNSRCRRKAFYHCHAIRIGTARLLYFSFATEQFSHHPLRNHQVLVQNLSSPDTLI
jgi:hypothetical protein